MNSKKCSVCEFVNFADAEVCKRCKRNFRSSGQVKNFEKLSTVCPSCNSNDTQSFEMAYQMGTSSGRVQTTSYNHELGVSVGSANNSSQTVLASRICPPVKPENQVFIITVAALAVVWLIAFYMGANISKMFGFLFGCLSTFLFILHIIVSRKRWSKETSKKQNEYKSAIAHWLRSWVCLRCGRTWRV